VQFFIAFSPFERHEYKHHHFEAQRRISICQGIGETGEDGDLVLCIIVTLQSLR
jgi:hypothetical protein